MVKLTSETDFVASSETFRKLADDLAALVAHNGPDAAGQRAKEIDDLKITLKENIQLADVVQFEAAAGNLLDSYLHVQGGRGVNGVLVELAGGTAELAHDIAVHIAFARPAYLAPEDVPAEVVEQERATLEDRHPQRGQARAGHPEDRRGSPPGLLQDRLPPRAALSPRTTRSRSRSSSAAPPSSAGPRSRSASSVAAPAGTASS